MKKILIALSLLFIMTGCDEKTKSMSCTTTTTANGLITKTTYNIDYIDDDAKYITITYDYNQDNTNNGIDGLNADTDGLDETDNNNNNNLDADDVIDGVVGDVIDEAVEGVRETILDIAGIKNRYENQLSMYDNIKGFSYEVDVDNNTEYKITYRIDMDKISDDDLNNFNVTRDLTGIRENYEAMGYTCK